LENIFDDQLLNINHGQFILLIINGVLIASIGPKNFIPTLHRRLRPSAYALLTVSIIWALSNPVFIPPSGEVPRWLVGTLTCP